MPESTTLLVAATLNEYVILVYKMFYSSLEAALILNSVTGSLICIQQEVALDSDLQLHIENGNVEAFVRSGMSVQCEYCTFVTYSCSTDFSMQNPSKLMI